MTPTPSERLKTKRLLDQIPDGHLDERKHAHVIRIDKKSYDWLNALAKKKHLPVSRFLCELIRVIKDLK
jgi:hypothetical protein